MTPLTQPLRDEHRGLLPHIEQLRTAGDAVGVVPIKQLRQEVDAAARFLTGHLLPHAQAEDEALYPVVAELLGAPEATATMRRDHVEVGRLIEELEHLRRELAAAPRLTPELERGLRRVLYGLFAVVMLHFAKEEEVYLPILDAGMTTERAREMFERMEHAAQHAMAHAAG